MSDICQIFVGYLSDLSGLKTLERVVLWSFLVGLVRFFAKVSGICVFLSACQIDLEM